MLNKLTILLVILTVFAVVQKAHAGLLIKPPLYLGLNSGLVGNWSFNQADLAGVIAYDRSGNANNGTLTNGPKQAIGKIGQGLSFDGVDDYVNVVDTGTLELANGTVSAWVKTTSDTDQEIFGATNGTNGQNFSIELGPSTGQCTNELITVASASNANILCYTTTTRTELFDGNWHNIVITFGGTTKIYIDGVSKTITVGNGVNDGTFTNAVLDTFRIANGRSSGSDINPFNGAIDDVRIYNRALSADEIKRLYKIGGTMTINKSASTATLTNGLIGYWSFDGGTVFNRGGGVLDLSGQGNNGTLTNGPTTTPGKLGQALSFDGVDDYINAGNGTSLQITGSLTISAWVQSKTSPINDKRIVSKWTGGDQGYALKGSIDNGPSQFQISISSDGSTIAARYTNTTIVANTWYHVVGVYNSSSQKLDIYLNGVLDNGTLSGTVPASIFNSPETVIIGSQTGIVDFWNGPLDDVRMYNRALGADEIKRLYKIGGTFTVNKPQDPSLTSLGTGLVGYWPFDGSALMTTTATASSTTGTSTPASNAAVAGRGDGNGFQTSMGSGSVAESGDGRGLLDIDSGTGVATDGCGTTPQNEADYHEFSNFDLSIPPGAWISGIEVELTATSSTATGTNLLCTALSWNGGTSTTTAKSSGDLPVATTTVKLGGPTDTWGHAWSTSGTNELSNSKFRLYIMPDSSGAATVDYWLDKVIARVYYTATTTKSNIAVDASGQGNNGTLTNGPTATIGKIGQGLSFDGVNDYVDAGSNSSLDQLGPLSISTWIYPRTFGGSGQGRIAVKSTNASVGLDFLVNNTDITQGLEFERSYPTNAVDAFSANNVITLNTWQHVVVTWDGGTARTGVKFYVNGALVSNGAGGTMTGTKNDDSAYDFIFGQQADNVGTAGGGAGQFDGQMDDVRIYNRALSAQEVTRLYNMGR